MSIFDYTSETTDSPNTVLMIGLVEGGFFVTFTAWGKERRLAFSSLALHNWFDSLYISQGEGMNIKEYEQWLEKVDKYLKERSKY